QFHPLVARAFAATVSGGTPAGELDELELRELRGAFASIRPLRLPAPADVLQPRSFVTGFLILALLLVGLSPSIAPAFAAACAAAAAAVVWALAERSLGRRRRGARSATETGSAAAVLAAAGFDAWTS